MARATSLLRVYRAANLTIRQFCEQTTLHGYKYCIDCRQHPAERCMWFLVLVASVSFAVTVSLNSWANYVAKPTVTSLQSQRHPVWEVPFPTISVCSINRISRQAARQYAEEIVTHNRHLNVSGTLRQMRYFGRLYEYSEDNFNDLLEFQAILDRNDNGRTDVFDVRHRMFQLTPKCSNLLMKCQWEGRDVPCDEIFSTRLTGEGFCCTFNNVRPLDTLSFSESKEPIHTCYTGPLNGLTVLLNTSTADYFYPIRNTVGFSVTITSPAVFVDEASGHVQRVIVPGRTEVFVSLNTRTVRASAEMVQLPAASRACRFEHELPDEYGGHYSFNDCLIKCKIRHYVSLCGCIPFNLPTNFPDFSTEEVRRLGHCNLAHLKCLHQFKITLNTFRPAVYSENPLTNSVQCPDCLPMCSQTTYNTQTAYSRIVTRSYKRNAWGIMRNVSRVNNVSIVRIYHPYVTSMLYTTNVLYTWEEMIGIYGGVLGLCIGFSIVGFMEVLYFSTYRLVYNLFGTSTQFLRQPGDASNASQRTCDGLPSYKEVERILLANRQRAAQEADASPPLQLN